MKTSRAELYVNNTFHASTPIYPDSVSIDMSRDGDEMYRRTKLDSTFKFVGDDYDFIYNSSLETEFEIRLYDQESDILLAKGQFQKTDCVFDTDNKLCTVKAVSLDKYDKLLAGLDNEYDLVELAPKREKIQLTKRAILQIYFFGDNKLTNIIGNMSYEVNAVEAIEDPQVLANMGFVAFKKYAAFTVDGKDTFPEITGVYRAVYVDRDTLFINENGYYFKYYVSTLGEVDQPIYRPDGVAVPNAYAYARQGQASQTNLSNIGIVWRPGSQSGVIISTAPVNRAFAYGRILLDTDSPEQALGTIFTIGLDDIAENNLNYRYAMQANIQGLADQIVVSYEVQNTPTKWGVNGEGKYFVQPAPIYEGDNVIPIGWNKWIPMSFWLNSSIALADMLDTFNTPFELLNAYPLWNAISVLLAKIDPTIAFAGTSAYSEFLYGSIPHTIIADYVAQLIYITPITNVKKTYYNQAARKGKITLRQILDMLKYTFQLYWFVDEQNRLRIEHITFFKNGGTYWRQSPLIDLTAVASPMAMKNWSFGQNTFEYDKSSLPKRYEFSWNDSCSEAFAGFPIDIEDKFVGNGSTEAYQVQNFISDLDLIISAPDVLSDDSFAVIGTNSNKRCPIVTISAEDFDVDFIAPKYKMQNAYLSFYFLELAYWLYNISGMQAVTSQYLDAQGHDGKLNVHSTKRVRTQSVKFPIPINYIGKEGIIKTLLGLGEWTQAKYTPEDGMTSMKLILDVYESATGAAFNDDFNDDFDTE